MYLKKHLDQKPTVKTWVAVSMITKKFADGNKLHSKTLSTGTPLTIYNKVVKMIDKHASKKVPTSADKKLKARFEIAYLGKDKAFKFKNKKVKTSFTVYGTTCDNLWKEVKKTLNIK